jgi:DNA gyrase subunit A
MVRSKKRCWRNTPRPRQGGINAIGINEGDALIEAKLTNGKNEILLAIQSGKAIRFNETGCAFDGPYRSRCARHSGR